MTKKDKGRCLVAGRRPKIKQRATKRILYVSSITGNPVWYLPLREILEIPTELRAMAGRWPA